MKALIRTAARRLGYDIIRHVDMPRRPIHVLPLLIDARIAAGESVRFVQIGANDGLQGDPLHASIVRHSLTGLLVEPLPDLFARLKANYSGQPGLDFEQAAIGDKDGEAVLYRIQPDPELPQSLQELASFNRDHLLWFKSKYPDLERRIEPLKVQVLTVASLLKKHQLDGIDLMQVDTEGFDCKIIISALRDGLRPSIINYEFVHAPKAEQMTCKQLLFENGYSFLDIGQDTLAVRDKS